uniref:AlNc14C421G11524 protein n=1 Tax=Albugo laibachii Nc14 TaxID=890382 RepID=F0WZC1_9STRA|nr:AlNc14C421G11524 [Albugo laibachii Nc14]|eukprot:CCA26839.1 AlNc14C421G11524 [Albugo laibachii Nc14]
MTGIAARNPIDNILVSSTPLLVSLVREIQARQQRAVSQLRNNLDALHRERADHARVKRSKQRKRVRNQTNTTMAQFAPGAYVLYTEVWADSRPKLKTRWNGPVEVLHAISAWIFEIRNLFTGETREAHASHLNFYADKELKVTKAFLDAVAHNSEGHVVRSIVHHQWDVTTKRLRLLVAWRGLDPA